MYFKLTSFKIQLLFFNKARYLGIEVTKLMYEMFLNISQIGIGIDSVILIRHVSVMYAADLATLTHAVLIWSTLVRVTDLKESQPPCEAQDFVESGHTHTHTNDLF